MIKRLARPFLAAARLGLLLLVLPMLTACISLSSILGLPQTKSAAEPSPWEKPRAYVKALDLALIDVADGFVAENKARRITDTQFLDAQPGVNAARQALKDATAMLKSADTDRSLADGAIEAQKRDAYLLQARLTEAAAVSRAAIAEKEIGLLRPVLDRARGLVMPVPSVAPAPTASLWRWAPVMLAQGPPAIA